MAAIIGNRDISLGVMGGTLITAACYGGGNVFGCSPYDEATTAYLKATYPAYWVQIRDYGWANPQLVPWINEDNDLIVSLVSVGKERWLVGDGVAYIYPDTQEYSDIEFRIVSDLVNVANSKRIFGCTKNSNYMQIGLDTQTKIKIQLGGGGMEKFFDMPSSRIIDVLVEGNPANVYNNGTAVINNLTRASISRYGRFYLFANGTTTISRAKIAKFSCWSPTRGTTQQNPTISLAPFIRNGEKGMLDLLTGTFYPNANTSGAFTIEITDR